MRRCWSRSKDWAHVVVVWRCCPCACMVCSACARGASSHLHLEIGKVWCVSELHLRGGTEMAKASNARRGRLECEEVWLLTLLRPSCSMCLSDLDLDRDRVSSSQIWEMWPILIVTDVRAACPVNCCGRRSLGEEVHFAAMEIRCAHCVLLHRLPSLNRAHMWPKVKHAC
jgi:hypothetical protein